MMRAGVKLLQQFKGLYIDPVDAAEMAAGQLFGEIAADLGEAKARWIFAKWGTPPSASRRAQIKNFALLSRLDRMKPKPVILKLAKQQAAENESLPRREQRGAGSTDVTALEKHIRSLVKKREKGLAERSWFGPVTEEQAIRHFGAKKVETFSPKR